jgi:hypothetical protein
MKNAYSAQITAAMAVAMTNRRRWWPVSPQVSVTARPAARDEPADDDHLHAESVQGRLAQARLRAPLPLAKNLRSAQGPKRRPMR